MREQLYPTGDEHSDGDLLGTRTLRVWHNNNNINNYIGDKKEIGKKLYYARKYSI